MPGRHSQPAPPPRRAAPIATAALLAAVLVGGAIVTTRPDGPARPSGAVASTAPTSAAPTATPAAPTATPTAPASPSRTPERASRGQPRATPTPAVTTSKAPPAATVVSSGTCEVSFYDEPQPTASGEPFDPEAYTAAHKTLPFDTRVRVTNLANGKSVIVRINDRGPYVDGRCLDLARAPFRDIASLSAGVVAAKYEVLG